MHVKLRGELQKLSNITFIHISTSASKHQLSHSLKNHIYTAHVCTCVCHCLYLCVCACVHASIHLKLFHITKVQIVSNHKVYHTLVGPCYLPLIRQGTVSLLRFEKEK